MVGWSLPLVLQPSVPQIPITPDPLCARSFQGSKRRTRTLTLRPGLTFTLPPVILWCFQAGLEFSEESQARAGLCWLDHPSARTSTTKQRWSVRVSSHPNSQFLWHFTGQLCAFWPSLLPEQEVKADTDFAVRIFPWAMRCGRTISPLFPVQQRVLLKSGRRGSTPILYFPWWRSCSLQCLHPSLGTFCLMGIIGISLKNPNGHRTTRVFREHDWSYK